MNLSELFSKMNALQTAAFFALLIAVLIASFFLGCAIQKLRDRGTLKKARADAVKRSRAVLGGQFGEQMAPYLPDFPCNPGDAHFLGKPVDFIAFCGSAEKSTIDEILFIEVKSGTSGLSEREKQLRAACNEGRVRYVEYRLPDIR